MGADESTTQECGEQHVDSKNTFFCVEDCGSRICKNCMRDFEGTKLCQTCKIRKTKNPATGGSVTQKEFGQTGSVKVNSNGEFSGWDSIFS